MNCLDLERLIENHLHGRPDFGYWLQWHKTWDRPQAAFLLLGKCPLLHQDREMPDAVANLLRIIEADPDFPTRIRPLVAVQWFRRTFGDSEVLPPELRALLEESCSQEPAPSLDATQAAKVLQQANPDLADRERRYQALVVRAKNLWKEGDPKNHKMMCDALLGTGEYGGLSRNTVLARLKATLEKMGKPELIYDKAKK